MVNKKENNKIVIWWIRRDLRISDNPALKAAADSGLPILPLFIIDPKLFDNAPLVRKNFLLDGLAQLSRQLEQYGGKVILLAGRPEQVFHKLKQTVEIETVYAGEDYTPYSQQRDEVVGRVVSLHLINGITIHHPMQFLRETGETYKSFTPFHRSWQAKPMPQYHHWKPEALNLYLDYPSDEFLKFSDVTDFPAGEAQAEDRLQAFLDGPINDYAEGRNRLDKDMTSALSPYFRFGMLSPLRAYSLAQAKLIASKGGPERESISSWLSELVWREFFNVILYYYPHVLKTAFREKYRSIGWQDNPSLVTAWQQGLTGFPVVDAGMRQLLKTGWMHNRARMITASFLVKDLLVDWRIGEKWFLKNLVDGDLAANNGGWQWTAGVGTDAAPYFRIFNPVTQGQTHDPLGRYVRKYVPELARVPDAYIQQPWLMPPDVQSACGCLIGRDYPEPIVDHAAARKKAMALYSVTNV